MSLLHNLTCRRCFGRGLVASAVAAPLASVFGRKALGACPGNGICCHKDLAKVFGLCRLLLSGQLGKVMGGANQRPFVFDPVEAAEEELTEAAGCFNLAEDGFNGMFA